MNRKYNPLVREVRGTFGLFAVKLMKTSLVFLGSLLVACANTGSISEKIIINSVSAPIDSLATLRKGIGNKKFSPCLSYVYSLDGAVEFEPPSSPRRKCLEEYQIAAGEYVLTVYCADTRGLSAYPRVKLSINQGKEYQVNCHATYKYNIGGIGSGFPKLEAVLVPVESNKEIPGA